MDNYKLSYSRQQRLKNEEQELDKNVAEIDKSNKFNNSVADIRTTKELSLKEIDNFIGKNRYQRQCLFTQIWHSYVLVLLPQLL